MIPLLINQSNIFRDFSLRLSKRLADSDLAVIGLTGIGPIRKISLLDRHNFVFIVFHDWIFNKRHTVAATSGIGTSCPSGEHEFSLVFSGVHVVHFIQLHVFMLFAR